MVNSFSMKIDLSEVLSKIEAKSNEVKDTILDKYQFQVWDTEARLYSDPNEYISNPGEELEVFKAKMKFGGKYTISGTFASGESDKTVYMRVYVNDTKVAELSKSTNIYGTETLTFNANEGDIVKLTIYGDTTNAKIKSIALDGYLVAGIEKID